MLLRILFSIKHYKNALTAAYRKAIKFDYDLVYDIFTVLGWAIKNNFKKRSS